MYYIQRNISNDLLQEQRAQDAQQIMTWLYEHNQELKSDDIETKHSAWNELHPQLDDQQFDPHHHPHYGLDQEQVGTKTQGCITLAHLTIYQETST